MPRGRPPVSIIRTNIIEILAQLREGYGYQISTIYNKIFPACTMRSIHYHLKKGLETKEFTVTKVVKEEGKYSWGEHAEKIYYSLGENAKPKMDDRVKVFFEKKYFGILKGTETDAEDWKKMIRMERDRTDVV